MAHYRVYLADNANSVQKAVSIDCETDDEAVRCARTLIKPGGRAILWDGDTSNRLSIGSLSSNPGLPDTADVRRSLGRYIT